MTDTIRCSVKSHPLKDRGFVWLQMANGEPRPIVTCRACDPFDRVTVAELTDAQAANYPQFAPKPPVTRTLI
jgi:hypothetical protein